MRVLLIILYAVCVISILIIIDSFLPIRVFVPLSFFVGWTTSMWYFVFFKSDATSDKWELVEEDVLLVERSYNIFGEGYSDMPVRVDIYRRKLRNGTYKYKNVVR